MEQPPSFLKKVFEESPSVILSLEEMAVLCGVSLEITYGYLRQAIEAKWVLEERGIPALFKPFEKRRYCLTFYGFIFLHDLSG